MPRRSAISAVMLTAGWLGICAWPSPSGAGESAPLPSGSQERVQVRLVTLDVVVEDRKGSTVPGLTAQDFDLLVDHRRTPVDTLDESCTGAVGPLRADREQEWASAQAPQGVPRRIILAFDYLHLPLIRSDSGVPLMAHTRALQRMRRALEQYVRPAARETDEAQRPQSGNGAIEFLLNRMRNKSSFPALSQTISAINRVTTGEAQSVQALTDVLLKDFALTNKLLRLVNSSG